MRLKLALTTSSATVVGLVLQSKGSIVLSVVLSCY